MSKLFRLREWMTVAEAAQHLTGALGEPVQEKDVYRLALDNHLRLSVDFVNHAQASVGAIVGPEAIEQVELPIDFLPDFVTEGKEGTFNVMMSLSIGEDRYVNFDKEVRSIRGIWDLMMLGGERLDIEHVYQSTIGGPAVELTSLEGALVEKDGKVAKLMESFDNNEFQSGSKAQETGMEAYIAQKNIPHKKAVEMRRRFKLERKAYLEKRSSSNREDDYYPANGLPSDSVIVVKTNAIIEFLQSLDDPGSPAEKTLQTKERNTLLIMIAALCNEAGIDYGKKGVAVAIEKMTENLGAPITDDTIRKVLHQIEDALASRSK